MDKLIVKGGTSLKGEVTISGAKNAVLPILAATLLTNQRCIIRGVPNLRDTITMLRILRSLGKVVTFSKGVIQVSSGRRESYVADYKLVSTMRASFCVLGPLLAKLRKAEVSLPGGCVIGLRPVDLHIKGLLGLGATIDVHSGYIIGKAKKRLRGGHIYLGGGFGSSVLATANVMMAATLAQGRTIIESAACEPEIVDLAEFLNKMGAKISGAGTPSIEIEGVKHLRGADHKVIPDRIEIGTFIAAAVITKGDILLRNAKLRHQGALLDKLGRGVRFDKKDSTIRVVAQKKLEPINVITLPFPGFPTDMQAQMMALLSITPGISVVTEKVYPDRFMHVAELNRMGARIQREGPHAIIEGVKHLSAAPVMASDLRASACLVLAGLVARGETAISRIYHLERGYEKLEDKLKGLGAKIWREKE